MSTPRINYNPLVLKELDNLKFFDLDPFMLLDIGISGGIENHWTIFKDNPEHFYPDNPVFFHERAIRSK